MRKVLSSFFSGEFSTITAQVQQEIKKPTVFFLRDLNQSSKDVPWVEIDSTWVIVKKRSEKQGLLSIINKNLFVAIGKSSQCEPTKIVADFQMEIEQELETYYCIDVVRANREVVCEKSLDQRLLSLDNEIYRQLNIQQRQLKYLTPQEIISIRDNDPIDSVYMIQKVEDPYFGDRYTITYADILEFLLQKNKVTVEENQEAPHDRLESVPVDIPVGEVALEKAICYQEPCEQCEGDIQAFYQETMYTSQDLRRSLEYIPYDCGEDLCNKKQLPLKNRKFIREKKQNNNRKMIGNKEGRDTNRYYDVANRPKD